MSRKFLDSVQKPFRVLRYLDTLHIFAFFVGVTAISTFLTILSILFIDPEPVRQFFNKPLPYTVLIAFIGGYILVAGIISVIFAVLAEMDVVSFMENLHRAEREYSTPEELETISRSNYVEVQEAVAKNPNTSEKTLRRLSELFRTTKGIKMAVASHENTPEDVLADLLDESDVELCEVLAKNPKTPATTLFALFNQGGTIREAVSENPNFTLDNYIDEFLDLGEDLELLLSLRSA